MKKLLMINLMFAITTPSLALSYTDSSKDYTFKYQMSGEKLEITRSADSYEEAYEQAAQQCFKHFKGTGSLSEDKGLDIIDVCANPRS